MTECERCGKILDLNEPHFHVTTVYHSDHKTPGELYFCDFDCWSRYVSFEKNILPEKDDYIIVKLYKDDYAKLKKILNEYYTRRRVDAVPS